MPDGDDPGDVVHRAIEESIGFDDDLAIRKVWKLANFSTGIRESFKTPQNVLGATSEALRCVGVIGADVGKSR